MSKVVYTLAVASVGAMLALGVSTLPAAAFQAQLRQEPSALMAAERRQSSGEVNGDSVGRTPTDPEGPDPTNALGPTPLDPTGATPVAPAGRGFSAPAGPVVAQPIGPGVVEPQMGTPVTPGRVTLRPRNLFQTAR